MTVMVTEQLTKGNKPQNKPVTDEQYKKCWEHLQIFSLKELLGQVKCGKEIIKEFKKIWAAYGCAEAKPGPAQIKKCLTAR